MLRILFWLLVILLIVGLWLAWAVLRPGLFRRRVQRARDEYAKNRSALEAQFCKAAAATGKPRGLAWTGCQFDEELYLTRDRANGEIVGLVGATISFEAIEGGGMEEVEAVGNLRAATAVLSFDGTHWTTQGRTMFNLEPREVMARYRSNLDPV